MAGPGISVLCLADTCASEVHPVFNPIAPYGYLLHNMYLLGAGRFDTICTAVCDRCDGFTACRLCRLEPYRLCRLEPVGCVVWRQ